MDGVGGIIRKFVCRSGRRPKYSSRACDYAITQYVPPVPLLPPSSSTGRDDIVVSEAREPEETVVVGKRASSSAMRESIITTRGCLKQQCSKKPTEVEGKASSLSPALRVVGPDTHTNDAAREGQRNN
ncbi:hypothetical protein LshimejAT787_0904550 [Lyophyllum shimeji]|uniref:Uncharacterized protein n=1 Tax=Lyophyllum shimeji TaxID=47721 RepID=A0A9P3PSJ1_LYOSH|nr:hypothetical protein LshimejAT787_0904550 [Lyophyllum shimeji]